MGCIRPPGVKQTPVQTLTGDLHPKKETKEHPVESLKTEKELTGTNLVPAPSHTNNREKLRGPYPQCEGSSLSDSPEISQRENTLKKGTIK